MDAAPRSITEALARQAGLRGEAPAFTFLPERGGAPARVSFGALDRRARGLAAGLLELVAPGERAVLMFPPGLEMVVALFACLAAGVVAVPLMLPRRAGARDSSEAVIGDCAPRLLLSTAETLAARPELAGRFGAALAVSAAEDRAEPGKLPPRGPEDLALLQYTSGSTSSPKGVMVSHGNLLANMAMVQDALRSGPGSTTVGWVPLYHDMGMMFEVMHPLHVGAHSVLMPPAGFMQRPLSWLRAIGDHRAEITCAPNFAFELCASRLRAEDEGLDLSSLRVAICGAEPVQIITMERFIGAFAPHGLRASAICPAYGLAEATLLVSGQRADEGPRTAAVSRAGLQAGRLLAPEGEADRSAVVACGRALRGEEVAIVDPERGARAAADAVGEIWVRGAHVAQGYWQNAAATAATFGGVLDGQGGWLRTGDLGFVDAEGALFVTGRIKDLVIIRGANHYPQDIERTVQSAHPALRADGGAAFAHVGEDGSERLVVVQEVERTWRRDLDAEAVIRAIRAAVASEHEVSVHEVVLIRPSALPKTTSGKVQRKLTQRLWLEGALAVA